MRRFATHDDPLPKTQPIRWRQIVQEYPCPVCEAGPGETCLTCNGNPKHEPHADRARLASKDGWRLPE